MLGSIIGALGSLAGGFMQKQGADDNVKLQKQFAQSGIQWKVADAKKAGIHPLYALGAQTHAFAPQSVGDMGLGQAGQDIGRAITATASQGEKAVATKLSIERAGLENELLRTQIAGSKLATLRQGQTVPMPTAGDRMLVDGQSGSGLVETLPMRRQSSDPGALHQEAGAVSDLGYTRTASGGYMPVMSKDAKDRLDDDTIGMLAWNLRNRIIPTFGARGTPPNVPLEKGKYWRYNPIRQEYQPYRRIGNDYLGFYY